MKVAFSKYLQRDLFLFENKNFLSTKFYTKKFVLIILKRKVPTINNECFSPTMAIFGVSIWTYIKFLTKRKQTTHCIRSVLYCLLF